MKVGGRPPLARRARRGEVGAAEDAEFDGAVADEGEGNAVLLAAQETLGAVDGVEGPAALAGREGGGVGVAEIDGGDEVVGGGFGPRAALVERGEAGFEVGLVFGLLEERAGFFGDQAAPHDAGLSEGAGDDGLGGEVADGDGGGVVLGHGPEGVEGALDVAADGGRGLDGGDRGLDRGDAHSGGSRSRARFLARL